MKDRCDICKRNYARVEGEIMPAVWGTFCLRCLLTVQRMVVRLIGEAKRD